MRFGPITNTQSLLYDTQFWTGVDSSVWTVADRTRSINEWYRRVNTLIWESSHLWQYDDRGYGTLPVAVTDLVDGQDNYQLPTTALDLMQVEVKDSNGDYKVLDPIDPSQAGRDALSTEFSENGLPLYYDVIGDALVLYPAPDKDEVTLTDGLRIYVSRDINPFSPTDTSSVPGFHANFHRLLSIGASYDYLVAKTDDQNRINNLRRIINDYETAIRQRYGSRMKDEEIRFIPKRQLKV